MKIIDGSHEGIRTLKKWGIALMLLILCACLVAFQSSGPIPKKANLKKKVCARYDSAPRITDRFSFDGENSEARALAMDEHGNRYVAGFAYEKTGGISRSFWVVRMREPGGDFRTVDKFYSRRATPHSILAAGRYILVGGFSTSGSSTGSPWTVRRAEIGPEMKFKTVDAYHKSGTRESVAYTGAAAANGDIYFAGHAADDKGWLRWITRKSDDGGRSFRTVDDFALPNLQCSVRSIATGRGGLVVAVGHCHVSWNRDSIWIVRRSIDRGKTWSIADKFQYTGANDSQPVSVISTHDDSLYVIGNATDAKPKPQSHVLVRKSTDGGVSWKTIDDFADGRSPMGDNLTELGPNKILASGQYNGGAYANDWRLRFRRSDDGGKTWVKDNSILPGSPSAGKGIDTMQEMTVDARGKPWFVGSGYWNKSRQWAVVERPCLRWVQAPIKRPVPIK